MRNREEKIIYKVYKKFYDKEPNFSKDNFMNLTIEIQAMAYLLNEYGVNIGTNGFCYEYKNLLMPMSMDIQDIIISKLFENKFDLNDESIEFDLRTNRLINVIGEALKQVTFYSENPIEDIRKIANTLYVKKVVCLTDSSETIIKMAKDNEIDLERFEQLVNFINEYNTVAFSENIERRRRKVNTN